jgi:hypothetical protein
MKPNHLVKCKALMRKKCDGKCFEKILGLDSDPARINASFISLITGRYLITSIHSNKTVDRSLKTQVLAQRIIPRGEYLLTGHVQVSSALRSNL